MGEKYTTILIGAFNEDIAGTCPDEGGWTNWAYTHDAFERSSKGYGHNLEGVELVVSYESEPAWVGFQVATLEYGETFTPDNVTLLEPAKKAWEKFQELVREVNVWMPDGALIIAHDQ